MRSRSRFVLVPLAAFLLTFPALAESPFDGHWRGEIQIPGQPLEIDVDLVSAEDGSMSGDISIPVQGLADFALGELVVEDREIRFKMPGIPGEPSFEGSLSEDGRQIAGTFRQGGGELPFELDAGPGPAEAAREALAGFADVGEQAVSDFNVPGVGIAVVAGGEVVFAEGFGYRDLEEQKPMTADSLFAIGSTTKAMTATLLGMVVDEGELAWDEPLTRYLPSFRLADPMITARITPRDLLTHRSGLPRHDLVWYNNNAATRGEMVARMAHLELTADLREKFQYNNLMFMTAGYLAGQLSGATWEEALRARLFEPLGMERSNFSVADSQEDPDHALPYRENDDDELERIPFRSIDLIGPAGSVNSSVREMSHWLLFNLQGGRAGEAQLINPSTLADIHSPHMSVNAMPAPQTKVSQRAYGMGWMVEVYRGHRRLQHGGGIDGFVTSVMFFPDDDLGLVAFSNRGSGVAGLVNQVAADRILGLDPIDWLGDAKKRMEEGRAEAEEAEKKKDAVRVAGTEPSHAIADYAGDYAHPGYGTLTVATQGEDAHGLELTYNGITAPLEHWHYDVWNGAETDGDPTFEDQKVLFRSDFDGQISSVVSALELTAEPIVFAKQPDARLSDPEYLERFVGTYRSPTGQEGRIELSGHHLTVHLPGQPTYTLDPEASGRFAIRGLQGFNVGFEEADGKVTKIVFYQPNGVFESERVEE